VSNLIVGIDADEDEELEWYIPQAILPSELQQSYNVIGQFLETPFDLDGKKVSELLRKKRARRRRRRSPSNSGDEAELSDEPKRKRKKKEKEQAQYKSAQFIQDSDEEYGDMEAFLEKERLLREKAVLAAAASGTTNRPIGMKTSGTKKRKRKNPDSKKTTNDSSANVATTRTTPAPGSSASSSDNDSSDPDNNVDSDNDDSAPHMSPTREKADEVNERTKSGTRRPRPRPRPAPSKPKPTPSISVTTNASTPATPPSNDPPTTPMTQRSNTTGQESPDSPGNAAHHGRRTKRLVLSDSDEE
jgi:replication fork protection complex subunit Tof1/Swi1